MKPRNRSLRLPKRPDTLKTPPDAVDRSCMRRPVAIVAVFAVLLSAGFLPAPSPAQAATIPGQGSVHGGFYSDNFHAGGDLDALATATGKRVTFGGTFASVMNDPGPALSGQWSNTRERIDEIWKGKATPFVNLHVPGTAAQIAAGNSDADINRWIDHLQLYLNLGGGRSLVLAPLQEMNGDWVTYGCSPTHFQNAYRRIFNLVRNRGIDETRVRFAFAPNGWTTPGCGSIADYYPGDGYVDVIGISAYRWADGANVYQVMGGIIDGLAAAYPTKPLVIAQAGAWPSATKSQWIRDMFSWAASHPHVVALIYFNFNKSREPNETDWRVWVPNTVNAGWRDGMLQASTAYQFPLTTWFQPGSLTLGVTPGVNVCPSGEDCDTVALQASNGLFKILTYATAAEASHTFFYGLGGDVPISGDWDCDGVETLGLYRRSTGYVYLRNSNSQGNANITFFFGIPGDVPVAGDFNGNGCDTVGIYRPSEGRFYLSDTLGSNGGYFVAERSFYFGLPGDKPFVGDFDGDGVDTVGLHRESSGFVYFRNTNTGGFADFEFFYGIPGDVLLVGDWNGNGRDTVGVYRPSTGMWYVRNSHSTGEAHSQVYVGPQSGVVSIRP